MPPRLWLIFVFFISPPVFPQSPNQPGEDHAPVQRKLDREDALALQRHYPFYFAYGRPLSKLQLSFKVPIVQKVPVYFGYTQQMFWALHDKSKPFRDLTYNPELFYRLRVDHAGVLKNLDFGVWDHNSNGKAGVTSRSFNKSYLRAHFENESQRWIVRWSADLAYLYNLDEGNKDIQNYIGPLTLRVSFIQLFDAWIDKSEVALQATPGGRFADRWGQGGYQVSWSFRLGGLNFVPAFYLQYYHGYAETLLNYDERVDVLRGGFIF